MEHTSVEDTQNSEFEKKLSQQITVLQDCQNSLHVKSCMKCEKLVGCETRKAYVQAVYDSMSKGETGGFEF